MNRIILPQYFIPVIDSASFIDVERRTNSLKRLNPCSMKKFCLSMYKYLTFIIFMVSSCDGQGSSHPCDIFCTD